eukprot:7274865-Pyramimonas_sp.AAC.1
MAWHKKAHRPVQLQLVDNGVDVQHYVYSVSPKLPVTPPPGPRTGPIDWTLHRALAERTVEIAADPSSDVAVVWALLTRVYGRFAVSFA